MKNNTKKYTQGWKQDGSMNHEIFAEIMKLVPTN